MTDDTIADPPVGDDDTTLHALPAGERYRVVERLGIGGMGEVVAARDEVLGREIAIKRMLEPSPTKHQIKRFLREARIQGVLDHPTIPPLHELAYDASGRPFFVMKRLIGTTLAEILENPSRRYPRERLLRAFAEVCLAVEFAHVRGVVHRDLKPSNIMLGDFGEVFVLDWGVAKVVGAFDADLAAMRDITLDGDGAVIGTPAYMSPEQHANLDELDGRSDVYSLGRVLADIINAFPDAHAPELDVLAAQATLVDRDARLRTARELGDRVQRYLDGDRDLAQRRRLASEHLARAQAALDAPDDQRTAMREAGRALALDPTLPGAAELVGRLMLEPPTTPPPEVEQSLKADRDRLQQQHSRRGMFSYFAYVALVPVMLWFGVQSAYLVSYGLVVGMLMAIAHYGQTHPIAITGVPLRPVLVILGNGFVVFIFSRMFSPFLIGPGLACVIITTLMGHSAYRNRALAPFLLASFITATVGVWVLEASGVIAKTVEIGPSWMLIAPPMIQPAQSIITFLIIYVFIIIMGQTGLTLDRARAEDDAQRQLHLQAWRLQQLVPKSA